MTTTEKTKTPRKSRAKKNVETIAITPAQADAILDAAAENPTDLRAVVKDVKKRKPSARPRDAAGKVERKGRNLSGNQPFARKYYYYDLDVKKKDGYEVAFQALPGQVRLLLKYMEAQGITTPDDALIGAEICGGAINSGSLQSKIDPAALFAYYRRVMETVGLRLSMSEGADGEVEVADEDEAGE
jgi:hypothetical protein